MSISGNELTLKMTPAETSLFSAEQTDAFALLQINVVKDGERRATRPIRIPVRANLKAEEIS